MNNSEAVFASLESLVKDQYQAYRLDSIQGKKTVKHSLGENISMFKGRGMDFDEVREYQSGDDVRLVDWRLTAKTGKAYTKIFHEERDRHIWFLLDLRKGMKFGTKQAFKSVIAAHITAMLSWFFLKKGDKIGGLVLSDKEMQVFNPSKIRSQVMTFFNAVSEGTKKKEHFEKKRRRNLFNSSVFKTT